MWISSDSKRMSGQYLLIILLNLVVYSEEKSNGMLKEMIDAAVAEISRSSEQHAVAKSLKLGKLVSVILKDEPTISKADLILTLVPIKCENENCFKDVKYCSAEVHMTKGSKFANFKNSNCTHEKKGIPNDSKQCDENAEDRNNDLIEKQISVEEVITDTIVIYKSMKDCVIKQLEKHIKGDIEMTGFQEKSKKEFAKGNITVILADIIRKFKKCGNVNMKCNIRMYFKGPPPVCQLLQYSCKKDKDNLIDNHTKSVTKQSEPTEKSVSTSENTEKAMSSIETTQKKMSEETTQKEKSEETTEKEKSEETTEKEKSEETTQKEKSEETTQKEMSEETTKETVPSSKTTEKAGNSVRTTVVITTKENTTSDKNSTEKSKSTSETTENKVSAAEITQKKVSTENTEIEVSSTERTKEAILSEKSTEEVLSSTKIIEEAVSDSETTKKAVNSVTTTKNGNENEDFVTAEIVSENMYGFLNVEGEHVIKRDAKKIINYNSNKTHWIFKVVSNSSKSNATETQSDINLEKNKVSNTKTHSAETHVPAEKGTVNDSTVKPKSFGNISHKSEISQHLTYPCDEILAGKQHVMSKYESLAYDLLKYRFSTGGNAFSYNMFSYKGEPLPGNDCKLTMKVSVAYCKRNKIERKYCHNTLQYAVCEFIFHVSNTNVLNVIKSFRRHRCLDIENADKKKTQPEIENETPPRLKMI